MAWKQVCLLFFGFALIGHSVGVSIREAIAKADAELAAEKRTMEAVHTPATRASRKGKKYTRESKAMDARNRLVKRSADMLNMDKFMSEDILIASIEGTMHEMFNSGGVPGGMAQSCPHLPLANFACSPEAQHLECDPQMPYRTITGLCNNLKYPLFGAASTALKRLIPPAYADGRGQPRGTRFSSLANDFSPNSIWGQGSGNCFSHPASLLPNPRLVSTNFHPDADKPTNELTHMFTQLAQYVDHDISISPEIEAEECCEHFTDEECFPIFVPLSDTFFGVDVSRTPPLFGRALPLEQLDRSVLSAEAWRSMVQNVTQMRSQSGEEAGSSEHPATNGEVTCLELTRSTAFCEGSADHQGPREQMNAVTAFIDASHVYGSSTELASLLRDDCDGLLKVTKTETGKELLPKLEFDEELQFLAGDSRATEMGALAGMHTIFVREHNRIARGLKDLRPHWDDETLYQNARRILTAEWQNVVFGEFLSAMLGDSVVDYKDLGTAGDTIYDPNVDATVANGFSTAAFRFGHTMIEGLITIFSLNSPPAEIDTLMVKDTFFDLTQYLADDGLGMERLLNGLMNQEAQAYDRFLADDVTNFLFSNNNGGIGQDLVARNIQRGRDHGIPGYNEWRAFCNLPKACSWNNRPAEISQDNWDQLRDTYVNPGDIDLFVGGLAEESFEDGVLGRTFSCIIGDQFKRLKFGDRFFFTNKAGPHPFDHAQQDMLRKRNLADIFCDNTDIQVLPKMALKRNSPSLRCEDAFQLDLERFV
ncbi:lactoperoxidase-like [Tigriopus californicus]|uniref:lactoperoxidase-like n=1 Tax=Tigriopus californicus TaxID=6832 RepID=UPI0027D9F9E4|nr:lactoperoxidase-like [Tigriopus californicus]|eukprot:TCALIF_12519-PA protein Name:"Similar to TPO Thyroid peroxidase (Sus scrofa)" AED:0.04 eAED:0.04 QI:62/1/1/1/0.75/0.8/5/189/763